MVQERMQMASYIGFIPWCTPRLRITLPLCDVTAPFALLGLRTTQYNMAIYRYTTRLAYNKKNLIYGRCFQRRFMSETVFYIGTFLACLVANSFLKFLQKFLCLLHVLT